MVSDAVAKLLDVDLEALRIVHYPHPVLRQQCVRVDEFGERLQHLAARMVALMNAAKGVGLAAPQVNVPVQMFVMNATGEPNDTRVYVNPEIRDQHQSAEAEEGCLSIPGININVRRAKECKIVARDLGGQPVELVGSDLVARIWQHETDHLHGVLILDRMGPADKIATRKTLRALEATFQQGDGGTVD